MLLICDIRVVFASFSREHSDLSVLQWKTALYLFILKIDFRAPVFLVGTFIIV